MSDNFVYIVFGVILMFYLFVFVFLGLGVLGGGGGGYLVYSKKTMRYHFKN